MPPIAFKIIVAAILVACILAFLAYTVLKDGADTIKYQNKHIKNLEESVGTYKFRCMEYQAAVAKLKEEICRLLDNQKDDVCVKKNNRSQSRMG